jgi:hypothetical protein
MADDATAGKLFGREKITDATAALFTESANKIPDERFIRTKEVQTAGAVVREEEMLELPVVDMASLVDPDSSASETAKLGSACREWGFFQVRIISDRGSIHFPRLPSYISLLYPP